MAKDWKFIDRGSFLKILNSARSYSARKRKLKIEPGSNDFVKDFLFHEKRHTERDRSSFSA